MRDTDDYIENIVRGRGLGCSEEKVAINLGSIDFNVDNDTPTSSTAVMNGFEFQKYAGIYLVLKNFGSLKALKIKEES